MEAGSSPAASYGGIEAPAQRRRTRCTMMHELSVPRRACPDSFSYLMIIAAILTSSSTLLGQPLEGE